GREIELVQQLLFRRFLAEQPADAVIRCAKLLVDRRPVDELQRLGEIAVALALTFARQFAGRLAERLQERVIDLAVGKLRRPRAERQAGELLRHFAYRTQS